MPAGRPTLYKPEYVEQVYKLCLLGATDMEIADFFNVTEQTVNNWKESFPDFFESMKKGKLEADAVIAQKLFHRAAGYEHPEDQIFQFQGQPVIVPTTKHYPPDTTAAIFWLKNRQPDKWRDRQEIETNINVAIESAEDRRARIAELLSKKELDDAIDADYKVVNDDSEADKEPQK
jgi:hypothetical protein